MLVLDKWKEATFDLTDKNITSLRRVEYEPDRHGAWQVRRSIQVRRNLGQVLVAYGFEDVGELQTFVLLFRVKDPGLSFLRVVS